MLGKPVPLTSGRKIRSSSQQVILLRPRLKVKVEIFRLWPMGQNLSTPAEPALLLNNTTISAESSGGGNSGSVTLEVTRGTFKSDNSTVSTTAQQGEGGAIEITAGENIELNEGTTVLAESFGVGKSGTVHLSD